MSASYDLEVAVPGTEMLNVGDGSSFRRIFVPVRSPQVSAEALAAATRMLSGTTSGVLTRRRRPAISRIVLGSVADQVMREANCPVLAVHPNRK